MSAEYWRKARRRRRKERSEGRILAREVMMQMARSVERHLVRARTEDELSGSLRRPLRVLDEERAERFV